MKNWEELINDSNADRANNKKKNKTKKKTSNVKFHLIGYNGLQTMATASNNLPNATQNI